MTKRSLRVFILTVPGGYIDPKVTGGFAAAFRALGHTVETVNRIQLEEFLRRSPDAQTNFGAHLRNFAPDFILAYGTNGQLPTEEAPDGIFARLGYPYVSYFGDDPRFWLDCGDALSEKVVRDQFASERIVKFIYSRDVLARCADLGPHQFHLPLAANDEIYKPYELSEEDARLATCDICFAGNVTTPRRLLIEPLVDYDLKLFCRAQAFLEAHPNSPLIPKIKGWIEDEATLAGLFRHARITLGHTQPGLGGPNMRVFEVLTSGGFMLSDFHEEIAEFFEDRKHLVFYRSPAELRDLADYFLAHPEERAAISEEGRNHVLANHTYRSRAESMIDVLTREKFIAG
ncbi:MAG: glycosyltransferase [Planctomycetes bacterium]|nr:glycosyltransferase [Planctomycetota bacterium]